NSRLDFVTVNEPFHYVWTCLPAPPEEGPYDYTIFAHQDDLETISTLTGCSAFPGGCGVFTSVSGSAPNRIFNIEWRAVYFNSTSTSLNFEVRLYEGQRRFDLIYGAVAQA